MIEETTFPKDWAYLLRISKSYIQTYLICPRKFYFQYLVAIVFRNSFPQAFRSAARCMQRSASSTGC